MPFLDGVLIRRLWRRQRLPTHFTARWWWWWCRLAFNDPLLQPVKVEVQVVDDGTNVASRGRYRVSVDRERFGYRTRWSGEMGGHRVHGTRRSVHTLLAQHYYNIGVVCRRLRQHLRTTAHVRTRKPGEIGRRHSFIRGSFTISPGYGCRCHDGYDRV